MTVNNPTTNFIGTKIILECSVTVQYLEAGKGAICLIEKCNRRQISFSKIGRSTKAD